MQGNVKVNLNVSADKMIASIKLTPPKEADPQLNEQDIFDAITNISYGRINEAISLATSACQLNEYIVVAKGTAPVPGEKSRIELNFNPVRELKPRVLDDGTVDYRDLGYALNVHKGDVLATKIPEVPGIPGTDVYGNSVPAPKLQDTKLPKGKGTEISEDGMLLLAAVDGHVTLIGHTVAVMNTLTLETVDWSTGDIDFVGNIQVNGDVTQGTTLKAAGDIIIRGILDSGTIIAGGSVIISNGYNGYSGGEISAKESVKCKYIQNGRVTARDIETGAVISSVLRAGNSVKISGANALVLGSQITARNIIECVNVGSETSSSENTLEAGNDPNLANRAHELPVEIVDCKTKLPKLQQLESVFAQLDYAGRLDQDQAETRKQVKLSIAQISENLDALLQEQSEITEALKSVGYGTVIVTGTLNPFAYICIGSERAYIEKPCTFVRFTRNHEGIHISPAR